MDKESIRKELEKKIYFHKQFNMVSMKAYSLNGNLSKEYEYLCEIYADTDKYYIGNWYKEPEISVLFPKKVTYPVTEMFKYKVKKAIKKNDINYINLVGIEYKPMPEIEVIYKKLIGLKAADQKDVLSLSFEKSNEYFKYVYRQKNNIDLLWVLNNWEQKISWRLLDVNSLLFGQYLKDCIDREKIDIRTNTIKQMHVERNKIILLLKENIHDKQTANN